MHIQVNRSFSPFRASADLDPDYEDWFNFRRSSALSWDGLLKKRLVVIVGEAGIGKTYEFQARARTLAAENQAAFFLPLNLLDVQGGFEQALIEQRYAQWLAGDQVGHFFLDAVDEALLSSAAALRRAVVTVREKLAPHLKRVSLYISSRITDWNIPEVQELIGEHLLKPLLAASTISAAIGSPKEAPRDTQNTDKVAIDLEVYSLDPLSAEDAKRLAEGYGAIQVDDFWQEVRAGDYEFLATRPLDLEWLVRRWSQEHGLGTYSQLLESAVTYRLTETNQSYVASGAVLSAAQLRAGAERLAAACVFSGRAYVQVMHGHPAPDMISPSEVLLEWTPLEHRRLLDAALFDEATYGRVKFHHRTLREYLAASWVARQIGDGLPVSRALSLFLRSPYGQQVLVRSRRNVLCWLACLDAAVRQRLIRLYPELLMCDGDPERWSTSDVIEAFDGYIRKLLCGYHPDWWNFGGEIRRVARALPPDVLCEYLRRHLKRPEVVPRLLALVSHGPVLECADTVFSLYANGTAEERHYALMALTHVATTAHKASITQDLLAGTLTGNDLIADALVVVGIEGLSPSQLAQIFARTSADNELGGGRMATTLKINLLPDLSYVETLRLLAGMLAALPPPCPWTVDRADRRAGPHEPWIRRLLPDVLLHGLRLMAVSTPAELAVFVDAAMWVESLHRAGYSDNENLRVTRAEIEKRPELRRTLAFRLAGARETPGESFYPLRISRLVALSKTDLAWLIAESLRPESDPTARRIWYEVARDLTMTLRGRERRRILDELVKGPDAVERTSDIVATKAAYISGAKATRQWKREERARKREEHRKRQANRAALDEGLEGIRSGESFGLLRWLVAHAAQGGLGSYTKIQIARVSEDFGHEVEEAFAEGLRKVWRRVEVPDERFDNRIPWAGLVGLASANIAFAGGLPLAELTADDVARLSKLSIWEIDKPEPWFESLVATYPDRVASALMPWLERALAMSDSNPILHSIELALKGPKPLKEAFLRCALEFLRDGKVVRKELKRTLYRELIDCHLVSKEWIARTAAGHLESSIKAETPALDSEWLAYWAGVDFAAAWRWLEERLTILAPALAERASLVAVALTDSPWANGLSGTDDEIRALVGLFRLLMAVEPQSGEQLRQDPTERSSVQRLRDRIPQIIGNQAGKGAQDALRTLAVEFGGALIGSAFIRLLEEHAVAAAERASRIPPAALPHLGEEYTREPRTEGELFEQVLARLQEVREAVEDGPFSDRVLFSVGMPEKTLQIWLAARLDDTPRRRFIPRFTVTREPQVDEDNRTDIEVSCAAGKVCIEIKPVDVQRSYSASSLVDTLEVQLVGQYLKGRNSRHGVLVLLRLDEKRWQLPNGIAAFDGLVEYLSQQAATIATRSVGVERLEVIGIDCASSPTGNDVAIGVR